MSLRIAPCLWFADQAEEAAKFYSGIFRNSKINRVSRYSDVGQEFHHRPPGSVMSVDFELDGVPFTGLNGGPVFQFNEAISLQVFCKDQAEVDYYWDKLGQGGDPTAQQCGWLKDKFGVSWQIVPEQLADLVSDQTRPGGKRAMAAMLRMKKIDLATIEEAHQG